MSGVRLHSAGGGYVEMTAPPGLATGEAVVLPSQAVDLSKVGAAWVAYTPVVTAGAGSFTTVSAVGRYSQVGKTVVGTASITITSVGSGTGGVNFTLPVTAQSGVGYIGQGRADVLTGNMLQVKAGSTTIGTIFVYNNTGPAASGEILRISFMYEAA